MSRYRSLARNTLLVGAVVLAVGCSARSEGEGPAVVFRSVPRADTGGPAQFGTIEGRVEGARADQRIVLYARSGAWWVQPFADQPFTTVQPDATWSSATHLGTEYAALLVDPGYDPPASSDRLPAVGGGVVAVAVVRGEPMFWQTWWFMLSWVLAGIGVVLALYRVRMRQVSRELNLRFEERLAERMRIAQELHDTLLQGFVSASMQLHVAVDLLPDDSPAKPRLGRVQQLMGQVIEEGRNAVRGLRSNDTTSDDIEHALSAVGQEFDFQDRVDFRLISEGRRLPLHPVIRDQVYRVGHEALANAFRHAHATAIEVEVRYASSRLCVLVRDDGCGIDPETLTTGRDGHWGLSGMRERAEAIGARLHVRSRVAAGTEVELSVPGSVAFRRQTPRGWRGWLARRDGHTTAARPESESRL